MRTHIAQALTAAARSSTISALAAAANIGQPTISRLIAGQRRADTSTLRALCTRLPDPAALEILIGHLRDEIERAGRNQVEVEIAPRGDHAGDDITILSQAAAEDEDLAALLADLARMIRAHKARTTGLGLHLAADDHAPYHTKKD